MGFKKQPFKKNGQRGGYSDQSINYKTRCAECGRDCTVPFRPNGRKPVLCSDCFQQTNESSNRGGLQKRSFGNRSHNQSSDRRSSQNLNLSKDIKMINDKLDQILTILSDAEIGMMESEDEDQDEMVSFDE